MPRAFDISLTVTDSRRGVSDADTVTVMVTNRPVANAGPDRIVIMGSTVSLDGTGSTDPDGDTPLTYQWAAPQGITLDDATSATPSFTAPNTAEKLEFSLVVMDSERLTSDTDTVTTVVETVPSANLSRRSPLSMKMPGPSPLR